MFKSFIFGLTIGSVGALLAMQYHLVRTDEKFLVVARAHQPPFRSTYVDVRNWNQKMWESYPELQEAVIKSGREEMMVEKKATPAGSADGMTQPLHDVSGNRTPPIYNAAEARNTLPASQPSVIAGIPPLNNGLLNRKESLPASTEIPVSVPPIAPATANTPIQRTVPQPDDIQAAISDELKQQESIISENAGAKRAWVQSLLKNVVPSNNAASQTFPSQLPQEAINEPANPYPVDAQPIPETDRSNSAMEVDFPASPRRISVPGGRDI